MRNETKPDVFPWGKLKSGINFYWLQILKYFNDFYMF